MISSWTIERWLRLIAGTFVMLSVIFAVTLDLRWLWFTGFVGLNLFQAAFTDWCPMMAFLQKLGKKRATVS
ncbi:MAG: YgaP family membrane protein [Candidatus Xenobia bacterium]